MEKHDKPHDFKARPDIPDVEYYTVQEGDTLSSIAKKFYGEGANYIIIYEVNKDLIGDDPDRIRVGQVLKIPKIK